MMSSRPGGSDDGLDIEEAWADIVAHWDADAPARHRPQVVHEPEPENSNQDAVDLRDESRINTRGRPRHAGAAPSGEPDPAVEQEPPPLEATWVAPDDYPEAPADETECTETEDDLPAYVEAELDERFTPAEPPPLSKSIPWRAGVAWLLILGPPVTVIILGFIGSELSEFRVGLAALAFMAGCLLLVLQLQSRDDDPPDNDGAVV